MSQLRLKDLSSSLKGLSKVFERSLKGVSVKFQCRFRKFPRSFKSVERFKGISREFQGRLKGISMEISVGFKVI